MAATAAVVLPGALPTLSYSAGATPISLVVVERHTIDVDGRAASVYGIRQPDGTPGLALALEYDLFDHALLD